MDTYFSIIKKKAAITVDDDLILFNNSTIYSNPVALIKKGRLVKINKCKDNWCKVKTGNFKGWLKKKIFGAYFN
jgi:SH3-like domain-containing protein